MSKLSVIIPVFNAEKYLKECLNSVIKQNLKDMEIICVNDGSTDSSLNILQEYKKSDNRIMIVNKDNGGLSSARNAGMKVATGDYFVFIDSDDIIDSEAYAKALKYIEKTDLVCFGIKVFGNVSIEQKNRDDEYYRIKYKGLVELSDDIIFNTDVSSCNKVFKKEIVDKYNIVFPEGFYYEDAEFYFKYVSCSSKAYFINEYFYNYRRNENSIMSDTFKGSDKAIHHLYITEHVFNFWKNNGYINNHKNLFVKIFLSWLQFAYFYSPEDKRLKILDEASKYADKFNKFLKTENKNILDLQNKKYRYVFEPVLTFYEKILNIKKFYDPIDKNNQIYFYILGIKFKKKQTPRLKKIKNIVKSLLLDFRLRHRKSSEFYSTKISVLMPVYNSEKHVSEAIKSILSQTFTDFEFIIINDGSTDNSANIIRQFKDPRIIFIDNKENKGLVHVLNQGLDMAKGEYIARMDADDISLPDRFLKQVIYMDKNKDVGVLGSWFHIFGDIDRIETKLKYPKLKDMINTSPVGHPTAFLRKSVFDKYNLRYDFAYKYAEDYELWTRVIKYTKIANLQEVLLNYRWSNTNLSAVYEKQQILVSEVIKQKIKKESKFKRYVLNLHIDDTQLLSELKNIKFSYMPNSGNMGDMLIAGATMHWFDENNLKWQRTKPKEYPKVFVYGGGGAWISKWIEYMKPTMDIMSKAEKVIILPSSFDDVPEFVNILNEKFVVFCRERKSYDYLISQKTKAKILLDNDMAFRLHGKFKRFLFAPTRELREKTIKLKEIQKQFNERINLFRTDSESKGHYNTDFDLSDSLGWFSQYESRKNIDYAMNVMLNFIYKFKTIHTDRLHVGIAAALTGADVFLYDNTYGKINGVYKQILYKLPNTHFNG